MGSSTPNATKICFRGFSQHSSAAVHARVRTPVGTGLSTPRDGAIMARPKLAGRQGRLTGHKYLRNKLSHRDVSSCRFSCEGRVSLHFTQSGVSMTATAGVVDEKGSEYILAHTGPRELDGHPLRVFLCFIKPILGNRYGPGVNSLRQ